MDVKSETSLFVQKRLKTMSNNDNTYGFPPAGGGEGQSSLLAVDIIRQQQQQSSLIKSIKKNNTSKDLPGLINDGEWLLVRSRIKNRPEEVIGFIDETTGWTILHDLCSKPPTPEDIFRATVDLWPDAIKVQEKNYRATPLHVLCWSSQRSVKKVQILLEHMNHPEHDMMARNRFGGTVLHSAAGCHAGLPVLKALIEKYPPIAMARTQEYNHTALTALWHAHLQSIPGHMQIARILKGEEVTGDNHFDRFWEKVVYLARESFKLSSDASKDLDPTSTDYVFHGLLHLRAPLNTLKVALRRNPHWAAIPDANGNFPLHHVVIRRPFRVKDKDLISELIQACPEAAGKKNSDGNAPIFIAIRDRMGWDEGLGMIANANTDVLSQTDSDTGLYPFLLAASLSGRVAVNTSFQLLCANPYLVKEATVRSSQPGGDDGSEQNK